MDQKKTLTAQKMIAQQMRKKIAFAPKNRIIRATMENNEQPSESQTPDPQTPDPQAQSAAQTPDVSAPETSAPPSNLTNTPQDLRANGYLCSRDEWQLIYNSLGSSPAAIVYDAIALMRHKIPMDMIVLPRQNS